MAQYQASAMNEFHLYSLLLLLSFLMSTIDFRDFNSLKYSTVGSQLGTV